MMFATYDLPYDEFIRVALKVLVVFYFSLLNSLVSVRRVLSLHSLACIELHMYQYSGLKELALIINE